MRLQKVTKRSVIMKVFFNYFFNVYESALMGLRCGSLTVVWVSQTGTQDQLKYQGCCTVLHVQKDNS